MKINTIVLATAALYAASTLQASTPQELFKQKCQACHTATKPQDRSSLVAPPIMGVMRHVKMSYNTQEEATAFIVDFVLEPTKEKSICKAQKVEKFGLMPSLKGSVTKDELKSIAKWLYSNYPPKGFRGGRR